MFSTKQQYNIQSRPISTRLSMIIITLLGIFLVGCASTAHGGSGGDKNVKKISKNTEKELTTTGDPTALVFSIDRKGRIQAFIPEGSKSFKPQKPVKALITDIEAISIVTSDNPKVCWRSTSGDEQCVVW